MLKGVALRSRDGARRRLGLVRLMLTLMAIAPQLAGGQAHAMSIERVGPIHSAFPFAFPALSPAPGFEIAPWFLHDRSYRYFVTTDYSYECRTADNLLKGSVGCANADTARVTAGEAGLFADPLRIPHDTAYKRNYEGVFTAQILTSRARGRYVVAIDHAENKNEIRTEVIDGRPRPVQYRNTVQVSSRACWSGVFARVYRDCNYDYNGFVDSSAAPDLAATGWGLHGWRDRGPIVWPRDGYVRADGRKASWGVRHPSSIVAGRYLYVFYLDTGSAGSDPTGLPTQGIGAGISVARAPITDLARPGTFLTWAGHGRWVPALPPGLTPANLSTRFARRGGASVGLLGPNRGSYYFVAARITHPRRWRYIGLEHYSTARSRACPDRGTTLGVALWESNDLVSWQHPTSIPQLTSCGVDQPSAYDKSQLRFPHFLNAAGTREDLIDPASFYLTGTNDRGVTLVHLSVMP